MQAVHHVTWGAPGVTGAQVAVMCYKLTERIQEPNETLMVVTLHQDGYLAYHVLPANFLPFPVLHSCCAGADCGRTAAHTPLPLLCSDQLEAHKEAAVVGRVGWDLLHLATGSGAAQANGALNRLRAGDVVNLNGGDGKAMPI